MWNYLWLHVIYHLSRWFPKNDRKGIRVVLLLFSIAFVMPFLLVLSNKESQRFCERDLLTHTIVALCLTIIMLGFSFLFLMMEPVVWQVKAAFHTYGVGCLIFTILFILETLAASSCKSTTGALYYTAFTFSIAGVVAAVILAALVPFWLADRICGKKVLDKDERTGICYEPVSCCSCVWHV